MHYKITAFALCLTAILCMAQGGWAYGDPPDRSPSYSQRSPFSMDSRDPSVESALSPKSDGSFAQALAVVPTLGCPPLCSPYPRSSHLSRRSVVSVPEREAPPRVFYSARLIMQSIGSRDKRNYSRPFKDPDVMRLWMQGRIREDQEIEEWFLEASWNAQQGPFTTYMMYTKEPAADPFVGLVYVTPGQDVRGERGDLEVGWIVMPGHQHKGYGTEAVAQMLSYIRGLRHQGVRMPNGFEISSLVATIHPDNKASARLAQHCGFVKDREIQRYDQPRDVFVLPLEW